MYRLLYFTAILLLFTVLSCQNRPSGQAFNYDGVQFNFPNNWEITAQDSSESNYGSVSIKTAEAQGSGFAFIEWNNATLTLEEVMDSTQQGFLSTPFFQKGEIAFEGAKEGRFAGQKALINRFTFNVQGIEYVGQLHSFQLPECNKTLMVTYQQQAIDQEKQVKDFELIEQSFSCQSDS